MSATLVLSIISTFIAGVALAFSYRAFVYTKQVRLRNRLINARERLLDVRYRLSQSGFKMLLIEPIDESEQKDIEETRELIFNLSNKMNSFQESLNVKPDNLSDEFLDRLIIDVKEYEGESDFLESKVSMLVNYDSHKKALKPTAENGG